MQEEPEHFYWPSICLFFYLKQKDLLQFSFSKSVLNMFKVLKNYIIDVIKNGVPWVFTVREYQKS